MEGLSGNSVFWILRAIPIIILITLVATLDRMQASAFNNLFRRALNYNVSLDTLCMVFNTYRRRIVKIVTEREIESPASHVWHLLGERFADIGEWADSIEDSSLDGHLDKGAVRTCELRSFGPASGTIKEELTHFDRDSQALTYVVRSGLPGFMQFVENAWTIEPLATIDRE